MASGRTPKRVSESLFWVIEESFYGSLFVFIALSQAFHGSFLTKKGLSPTFPASQTQAYYESIGVRQQTYQVLSSFVFSFFFDRESEIREIREINENGINYGALLGILNVGYKPDFRYNK